MLLLRKLYRLSDRRQRLLFAWLAFLFLVTAALDAIGLSLIFPLVLAIDEPVTLRQSGFARPFLDLLGVEDETAVVVTFGLSLVAVFLIKNVLLGIIWRYAFSQINLEAAKTASRLVKAHLESPFLVQVQEKNSELIRNVANEVHQMFTGVIRPMLDLVRELSLSAGLLVALLLVQIIREENPFVTLAVVFIVALASTAMMIVLNRLLTTLGTERTERFAGMIGWLNDVWHSPREIKIYGVGKYFSDGFEKDATRYSYTLSRNQFYAQLPRLSLEFVGITAIVVLILGIALGGSALANALPTLALIFIILIRLMPSTSQIVSAFTAIRFSAPAVEIIYDKLISSRNGGRFLSPHQPLDVDKNFHRVIEVQNVSFTYPGSLRSALNGINLKITAGEKIGIVGASGSGKTTLLHLILGLNYPTEGKILIDGIDIRECREQWQRDIGILPQEIYLRDSTIRENVALGIPDWDVDGARVKKSLTEANLWEFVKSLPLGIETQVGDRGAKLSGGQRQRLGLARALYRDPHVLVLDEPTAALDEQTESMVLTSIFDVAKDRTAIIVTHKPYLMDHCDTVITVVDGRISTYESSRDYRVQSDMLERPINT